MSQHRIFIIIILALLVASGGFIFYLATSKYEDPKEIAIAEDLLAIMDAPPVTPAPTQTGGGGASVRNARNVMRAILTLTATPTATPAPSPTPVPLSTVIHPWTLVDIDDNYVVIIDQRTNEETRLELNGPGKSVENQGVTLDVRLVKVNFEGDSPEATFCADEGNCATKSF